MMQPSHPVPLTRRHLLLGAASLGAAGLLAACGGGGGDAEAAPAGGGGSGASFASGPITGFGSIIVGGVRFDDSVARVEGDDGQTRRRDELKLGSVVEIEGGRLDRALGLCTAMRVVLGHSLLGPRDDATLGASSLVLLGQTVVVTDRTVFDASVPGGTLDGIKQGDVVEAHALYDPADLQFIATRLEVKTGVTEYRLRGPATSIDTANRTFMLGTEAIYYGNALPAVQGSALFEGAFVRVHLQTAKDTVRDAWVATRLRVGLRALQLRNDAEAEVEGVVARFVSLQDFTVNGMPVDASGASFPDGSAGVVAGARVEVSGTIVDGVLVATQVELEDSRRGGNMGGQPRDRMPFEFHGAISGLDTGTKTFALRGMTIWYGGTVEYRNGTEANLADGRRVEVKGVMAADRQRIEARLIEFES